MQEEAPGRDHSKLLVNFWMVHVNQQLTELLQQSTKAINAKEAQEITTTTTLAAVSLEHDDGGTYY